MIKASILTGVLLVSGLLGQDANAGLLNIFGTTPKVQSEALRDVYSGIKFQYYDRDDRVAIITDFLRAIELDYALLPLKAKRIGLDFKKVKEDAINAELAVGNFTLTSAERKDEDLREKISFLQADSNMNFLDRMQLLVAKFQDTHFGVQEKISRPVMYNGIRLFRIEGKIVVGMIDKKFITMVEKLSKSELLGKLNIGDEVLSIDDVNVEKKVDELKPYIGGSSAEFIDLEAVRSLTLRNFKYEKKNFVKIAFKSGAVLKLPIFINTSMKETPRLDAITYFNKYNIPSDASAIGITFDKASGLWVDSGLGFTGYSARLLGSNLKGLVEMVDDGGAPAIRTGYFLNKGKTYAVMQLLTFATRNVKVGTTEMPYLAAIAKFAMDAKENGLPVILDLRVNGGGNGSFPAEVLGIFTDKDTVYPGPTFGYRVTPYMRIMEEPENFQRVAAEDQTIGMTYDDIRELINNALDAGAEHTPMYAAAPAVTARIPDGFDQKMVILVTANCISACDMTAALFKASKRATIIGTHTNGTGAGYRSSAIFNTKWEDPLRLFSSNLPNFLFGKPGTEASAISFGEDSVEELCLENRPTVADVAYNTTKLDFAKDNLGWLLKAVEVLDKNVSVPYTVEFKLSQQK